MKKMRILIAEDEVAIAALIRELIDFDRLNLELAGIAYNGKDALEQIIALKPEIVITDISMPVMSGLELIEQSQSRGCSAQFIIISGLTQFEYALTAIKMGVVAYLLKPINQSELNDVLEKTVLQIAASLKIDYHVRELEINSHHYQQKLRRSFLQEILYNKEIGMLSLSGINEDYRFHFLPETTFMFGIALVDGIAELSLPTQKTIIEQLMRSFQTEVQPRCIDCEVFNRNNHFVFLTDYYPGDAESLIGTFANIHDDMQRFLTGYDQLTVTLCCGRQVREPDQLRVSMESAYEALHARILMGSEKIIQADRFGSAPADPSAFPSNVEIISILKDVDQRNQTETREKIEQCFRKTVSASASVPQKLPQNFQNTMSMLLSAFGQAHYIEGNITDLYMRYCDQMEPCHTVDSLTEFSVSFIMDLLPFQSKAEESKVIQTAREYIRNNLSANLKLEDVADQVFLAPGYFGVLFKKETGEAFSAYLTSVRMEKAKEYLRDIRLNISEVAVAVGYQDKRYFSKLFREQVGLTPKEYRKIYSK